MSYIIHKNDFINIDNEPYKYLLTDTFLIPNNCKLTKNYEELGLTIIYEFGDPVDSFPFIKLSSSDVLDTIILTFTDWNSLSGTCIGKPSQLPFRFNKEQVFFILKHTIVSNINEIVIQFLSKG